MQLCSLLVHGLLVLLILLAPWPEGYAALWLSLVTLVVFGFIRSQRSIKSRQGAIALLGEAHLRWQRQDWQIVRRPWLLKHGVLLSLRQRDGRKQRRLWLSSDSMDQDEWRHLCQVLLQHKGWADDMAGH